MIKVLAYKELPISMLHASAAFDSPGLMNSWSVIKLVRDNLSPPQISANRAKVRGVRPVGGEGHAGTGRTAAVHLAAADVGVAFEVLDSRESISRHEPATVRR